MTSLIRAIVLDFDGVLVESEGIKTEIFHSIFIRYPEYYDAMMLYHQENISVPRYQKFVHFAKLLGCENDQSLLDSLALEFSVQSIKQTIICPEVRGTSNFLREFSSRIPLYVASLTPESDLIEILKQRGWFNYFVEVFGYPPRPKAQSVQRAADLLNCVRSSIAMIGDSPSDLYVAVECGIEFIGRNSGIIFPDPCPILYQDMSEIAEVIRTRIL